MRKHISSGHHISHENALKAYADNSFSFKSNIEGQINLGFGNIFYFSVAV